MNGQYRMSSRSEPSLGWEALPPLGADPHAGRARIWRRMVVALVGFWLVAGAALIIAAYT